MANFCLQKLHILPSQFDRLPIREKAFVIASVSLRVQSEIEQQKQMNKRGRKR